MYSVDDSSEISVEDLGLQGIMFQEPSDYFKPEQPAKSIEHNLLSGQTLHLRLVGHNPLWGHHLWNGAKVLSTYLQHHPALIRGRSVLELGAGAGLPSIVANMLGAERVVVTDYPDAELIENLEWNIKNNCPEDVAIDERTRQVSAKDSIAVEGYLWGADPTILLEYLHTDAKSHGFGILLMADLLFNHSCHQALLQTICSTMKRTAEATALIFFTPYRPWLLEKDLAFFDICQKAGLRVEKVLEEEMDKVMFEDDRGDEALRRRVFGYEVKWREVKD